ncbi:MAG: malto-oligosyltrehalose synthase, partial [Chloroflexota bacterium]|nr:malto-oligosyltrehalose synthase [Chloroflexota bacterium]
MTALNPTSVGEKSLRHADPPLATYRLQFGGDLTFANASRLVPYLDQLGVSHIYASPYVAARPGSLHGYDVANPNSLNPEIGSETEYRALAHELARHGMSQVLDWVPNHMAIGYGSNAWWQDVMEKGPSSIYAAMFDIDWSSGDATWGQTGAAGKVILPVLGDHYGRVLERGELSLAYEAGELQLRYYAYILPIALRSYLGLLTGVKKALEDQRPGDRKLLTALGETIALFKRISDGPARSLPGRTLRFRRTQQAKLRLRSLYQTSETFRVMLDAKLASVNGERGRPASFDSLDEILNQQWYRLAHWRVAAEEINYRRFFDINELVALRMENEEVFRATHHLFLQLLRTGAISGVRIDHIDGLRDPAGHLWRLQKTAFVELNKYRLSEPAGGRQRSVEEAASQLAAQFDRERKANPHSAILRPLWVVVEKILSETEWLRESWPVHGTTGYEFMNQLNGIFVNRANGPAMERVYFRFIGSRPDYREVVNSAKKTVMLISFPGEINRLAARLKRVAAADRSSRDFTLNGLTFAIRELIAAL